jgi:carbon-monoxide dehydrogenase small subunit
MTERVNRREIGFELNGERVEIECADSDLLIDVLRDGLGLTGVKRSCDMEICGACTVLVEGQPISACSTLAYEAREKSVETIEGVAEGAQLHPLQRAFIEHGALQCGFCTPGMVLTAKALLARVPTPTPEQVIEELDGNLCRCTGYFKIVEAVMAAAQELKHREGNIHG